MSRCKVETAVNLDNIIVDYYDTNNRKTEFTKEAKKLGDEIKSELSRLGVTEFSSGSLTVSTTTSDKSEFNEDFAIEIIRKAFEDGKLSKEQKSKIIRTKEYIDDDALEAVIYSNPELGQEVKKAFTAKPPVVTLRIKKRKD